MSNENYDALMNQVRKAGIIDSISALVSWDMQVMAAPGEVPIRSQQFEALAGLSHELLVSRTTEECLSKLENADLDDDQKANVRAVKRDYERASRVPEKLVKKLAALESSGRGKWVKAKGSNDFASMVSHLEEIIELNLEKADAIDSKTPAYQVVSERFDQDASIEEVTACFGRIKEAVVPLIKEISRLPKVDDSFLEREVDEEVQMRLCKELVATLGYDFASGRLDKSRHAFTSGYRITTRFTQGFVESILAGVHEAGHGMYEQGLMVEHFGTPLGLARSMSVHESQSRLWENHVGRSSEFWSFFFPRLKKAYAPVLDDVEEEQFHRAINAVKPGLMRTMADEATYPLHIILRTDLEQEMMGGKMKVKDLPQAWNEGMRDYLGVVPESDADGVLQDPHWYGGYWGYFPTYTRGSMMSAQQFNAIVSQHPEVPEEMSQGKFSTMKSWLNRNIHAHGGRFDTNELIKRATGKEPSQEDYVSHLKQKFGTLYGLLAP